LEPLTIRKGSSSTATTILDAATGGSPTGTAGESVFDTATVTGNPAVFPPTGTVAYFFIGPELAGLTPPVGWTAPVPTIWAETVTLSGGPVPNSAATPPLPAGNYRFLAIYSGDRNYIGSIRTDESLKIGPVSPILTTTPDPTTVELGPTTPPVLKD